jgi:hypothetical protein
VIDSARRGVRPLQGERTLAAIDNAKDLLK